MSQAPPTRRRWFQFSIGTMLVVMTLFAIWLGWQVRLVQERQAMKGFVGEQGGIITALKDWRASPAPPAIPPSGLAAGTVAAGSMTRPPEISVPFWRGWIGDEPIVSIAWPEDAAKADIDRAMALFPEAQRHTITGQWIDVNGQWITNISPPQVPLPSPPK